MKNKNNYMKNELARRIVLRYFLTIVVFIAVLLLSYYMAWAILSRFTWQGDNPFYILFKVIQELSLVFVPFILLIGIIGITYHMFKIPLNYLDEILQASEALMNPSNEPIQLSGDLESVQNKLNLVRETALRSASQAKEAEQRKNDLIVYLAHDLKTPLTSVIGYLTLLRDEPDISTELRCRYTGIALEKAERLEDLINEFFDITRFNLTALVLEPERMNLSRMLEQITYEFNPILMEKELYWTLDIQPDIEIVADADKLERVFDNLIRNAINYSYAKSELICSMHSDGIQIEIKVQNHGKTIPKDKLNRIFEQFFRLDSSRSASTGGAGLGLAISKEIVELHHGIIKADSENESITFTILLPMNGFYSGS